MNQKLFKLIDKIKDNIRDLDDTSISHPNIDKIYDLLTEMEDIIYENEESDNEDTDMYYE